MTEKKRSSITDEERRRRAMLPYVVLNHYAGAWGKPPDNPPKARVRVLNMMKEEDADKHEARLEKKRGSEHSWETALSENTGATCSAHTLETDATYNDDSAQVVDNADK